MSYELFGDLALLVAVVQYRFAYCSRCCIFASLIAFDFASLVEISNNREKNFYLFILRIHSLSR